MPALPSTSGLGTLVDRSASTTNSSTDALQVICAWPLSGQYGPGSRVLFYTFVLVGIFGRKSAWLKSACFAAMLLFPAVAALHGIVLAAVHVNGAVDMDIYGAFQTCSIGVIAAPTMLKGSRTYFYKAGRNTIFLWVILVSAGLLSLTIEFYRVTASNCTSDNSGDPISLQANKFLYGNTTCGLRCSTSEGPYSRIRSGSTNNIYVIPAPSFLNFGVATLLAAATCIPAILMLISIWNKLLEISWKERFGESDLPIEGTNGATAAKMKQVDSNRRAFLSAVEIPIYLGIALAILIIGERNFFSGQVYYQTEPMSSVGEWAPLVGTGVALLTGFVQDRVDRKGDKEKAPAPPAIEHATQCRKTSSQQANITADSMGTPDQSPPSPSLSTILRRPPVVLALPPDPAHFKLQNLTSPPAPGLLEYRLQRRHSFHARPSSHSCVARSHS